MNSMLLQFLKALPWFLIGTGLGIQSVTTLLNGKAGISKSAFFAVIIGIIGAILTQMFGAEGQSKERQKRIEHLELKAEEQPEKVRFAWDLARVKLEAYFDRNLNQVKMIFYVAVAVMLAGFCFILWGLRIAVASPEHVKVALIASASGVITQFIGLTFMVIYKSTMLQANQFMSVLERINTVGMAVGILDAIQDESDGLKDTTRAEIVRLLLSAPSKTAPDKSALI